MSSTSLRLPAFRLVKEGRTLPPSSYTRTTRTGSQQATGVADAAAIFREFDGGATIVLQGMHRYWQPVSAFCRRLEIALSHPIQANAYITPPGAQGFAVHQDEHDVFVLQSHGSKRWWVYDRGEVPPTAPALIDTNLDPGDSLYIPRSFPHAAITQRAASVHLTIGILSVTLLSALQELAKLAERDPAFAEPLPLGFAHHPEELREAVADGLREIADWVAKNDPDEVSASLQRRFLTTRQPQLSGHLRRLLELPALGDDSVVRRREGALCVLVPEGDELSVLLGDRELRMPGWLAPAMRDIAERDRLTVGELAGHLDEAGRMVLVRRLIREGLLEVAG